MNSIGFAYLVAYILIYFGVVGGIWIWRVKRRRDRAPVEEKLLRVPGESLRLKLFSFDDLLLLHLTGTALVPLLVMVLGLWIVSSLTGAFQTLGYIILLAVISGVLYFAAQWLIKILEQRRTFRLGYFGEREVGEAIDALRLKGFLVYHNVPALEAQPPFQLDHVIVGSTGVFALQTKARTRQEPRPGFADHKIIFDGQKIIYPWGDDFQSLEETRNKGLWLECWLAQIIGRPVAVQPLLVFPGWWVEEHAFSTVRVLNPRQVGAAVNRNAPSLTDEQVLQIGRQLEARCRDVDF